MLRSPGYTAFFETLVGVQQGIFCQSDVHLSERAVYTAIFTSDRDENVIPNRICQHPNKPI